MRPEPLILAFDTAGPWCAAALIRGDVTLELRHEAMERGQAERLIPLLEEMLASAGVAWTDLDRIAIGTGPGNFTGVRIAVAAARGLSLASGRPALGVSALEAAAFGLPRPVTVVEALRRGEACVQTFTEAGAGEAALCAVDALRSKDALAGSGAAEVPGAVPLAPVLPPVLAIARIAADRPLPCPPPAPFYLRGADASPPSDPAPRLLDA